jgi:hypothetical protein
MSFDAVGSGLTGVETIAESVPTAIKVNSAERIGFSYFQYSCHRH